MQGARQRAQQRRLPKARHALEQNMARRQQADEHTIDYILLSDNNLRDFLPYLIEPGDS
jgi:hypothetical protein